jgi:cytochrome c oxidase subunit 3
MTYTVVLMVLLMSVVAWWLVKQTLNQTPWAADGDPDSVRTDGVRSRSTTAALPSTKLALGVFLAVATALFALFISAYSIRMEYGDWRPMPEPTILWVNSGILVLSSIFLQYAWNAAKRENLDAVRFGVAGGGVLTLGFIVGQLMAWNQLSASGYFIFGNPANAFFYLLTAVHGLHLIGGLVALGKTVRRVWRADDMPAIKLGAELCAVYWHYLLAIWVILFGFMLST